MIKLIASDMDGTLLLDHYNIGPLNIKAIKLSQMQGVRFAVCTGRSYQEAYAPIRKAELKDCSFVCVNGAQVFNEKGELIYSSHIEREQALKITEILKKHNVYFELSTNDGIFSDSQTARIDLIARNFVMDNTTITFEEALIKAKEHTENMFQCKYVADYAKIISSSSIKLLKFLVLDRSVDEKAGAIIQELKSKYNDLAITTSGRFNLEINNINAQKGIATRILAEHYGVLQDEILAFGDNNNDISMLEYAGISYAVENATVEAKRAAKKKAEHHLDSGVGKAIMKELNLIDD